MPPDSYFDKLLKSDAPTEPFLLSDQLVERELAASLLSKRTRELTEREVALSAAMYLFDPKNQPARDLWQGSRIPDEIRERIGEPILQDSDYHKLPTEDLLEILKILIYAPIDQSAFVTGMIHLLGLHKSHWKGFRELWRFDFKFVPKIFDACRPHDAGLALAILNLDAPTIWVDDKEDEVCLLAFLDPECLNEEVAMTLARKGHGQYFQFLPKHRRTEDFWREALAADARVIKHFDQFPESMQSPETYREAVKQDMELVESAPEEFLDEEMCIMYIDSDQFVFFDLFEKFPESTRDAEICRRFIERALTKACRTISITYWRDSSILARIPAAHRTYENCLAVLSGTASINEGLSDEKKTDLNAEWSLVPDSIKERIKADHAELVEKIA